MSTALYAAYNRQEQLRLKRKHEQLNAETRRFTRNKRKKTTQMPNFSLRVNQVTNENVALSVRVNLALEMREKMFPLDVTEVVKLMTAQQHLIVKLADASLHTSYVPLQQLFFVSLASLLSALNASRNEMTIAVRQIFRENLQQMDKVLLSALPVDEVVEVIDPGNTLLARKQVNTLNRSSNVCRTCILRKCWVSSCGKENLLPLVVDEWLDFGGTTLTFYQQLQHETILYNIPYNCIERLEFAEEACLGFIFTKHAVGLYGINLAVFAVESADFSVFRDTLTVISTDRTSIRVAPRPVATRTTSSRPNLHYSAKLPVRLETCFVISALPSVTGTKAPIHRTQAMDTMIRRACEKTTQTMNRITSPVIATDANLTCRELVLAQLENNVLSPRERICHPNSWTQFTNSTPFSWIRTIQNQTRKLLLNSDRVAVPDSSTDFLTRAKAECLRDLKESMGYVEEPEARFPRWSILMIAVLVVIPWSLLVVKMYDF